MIERVTYLQILGLLSHREGGRGEEETQEWSGGGGGRVDVEESGGRMKLE